MTTASAAPALPAGRAAARLALGLDAGLSGLNGLVFLALSGPLADAFGVDRGLVLGLGAFFVLYAGALAALAARPRIPARLLRLVAAGNAGWVVLSVAALATGLVAPAETAGDLYAIAQALLVLDFALLQVWAARRAEIG